MSRPERLSDRFRQDGATSRGRGSATTAEGIAGERALLARLRGHKTAQVTVAARRLKHAARADARAG